MIWVILSIGFVLRLINLNQSLWLDEGINTMAAKSYSLLGMLTQYAVADFHPPGWFAILWVWGRLTGFSEVSIRFPSVIFGVLTIYVTYLIGKKLVSRNLGLLAALLLSINPLHIFYSQEARMYSLAALAVSINILLLIKLIKGQKVNLFFLIFSNLGVLISDYIAYFIFIAEFIILLIAKREKFQKWFIALGAALILFSWWIPVFLRQLEVGAVASANLPTWKFVVGGFDLKTLPLTFVKFIIGRVNIADKIIYFEVLLPVCTLFVFLLFRGVRLVKDSSRILLLSWIVVPLLVATIISIVVPVFSYFRVLYILPAFCMLISLGILSFNKKLKVLLLGLVVFIELFCSFVYLLNSNYQREDWKGLVDYFMNIKPSIVLFESSGTFPPFDYYAGENLKAVGALNDFPVKDESELKDLKELLKNENEVYLVEYLVRISDPKRLVEKKLTDLGYKEKDIKDFHGVGFVYHYVK